MSNLSCGHVPFVDAFTEKIPKSPVRELLEMEPETAKFEYVFVESEIFWTTSPRNITSTLSFYFQGNQREP